MRVVEDRLLLETKALHTHKKGEKNCQKKPDVHKSKNKGFEHIELPAKLLNYFSRRNTSNIHQSYFNPREETKTEKNKYKPSKCNYSVMYDFSVTCDDVRSFL